mmetsp:Transcript_5899/g.9042  ORF Transcript_5899/g.9042 Transcript_5899/m.9042 type:complete len:216 (-) Transcript_5899:2747-3394(-)
MISPAWNLNRSGLSLATIASVCLNAPITAFSRRGSKSLQLPRGPAFLTAIGVHLLLCLQGASEMSFSIWDPHTEQIVDKREQWVFFPSALHKKCWGSGRILRWDRVLWQPGISRALICDCTRAMMAVNLLLVSRQRAKKLESFGSHFKSCSTPARRADLVSFPSPLLLCLLHSACTPGNIGREVFRMALWKLLRSSLSCITILSIFCTTSCWIQT